MARRTHVIAATATSVAALALFGAIASVSSREERTPVDEESQVQATNTSIDSNSDSVEIAEPLETDGLLLRLDPPELNLGPTMKGAVRTATIRLINDMAEPIEIASISSDCGCVTIDGFTPDRVDAQSSVEIPIRFTAPGRAGRVRRSDVAVGLHDGTRLKSAVVSRIVETVAVIEDRVNAPVHADAIATVRAMDGAAFQITGSEPSIDGISSTSAAIEHHVAISPEAWRSAGAPKTIVLNTNHPAALGVVVRLSDHVCKENQCAEIVCDFSSEK